MQLMLIHAAVMLFSAFMQSTVGFAFSLFALPLLLMAGMQLPAAVMLIILSSLLQRILMVTHLHAHIPWRRATPVMIASLFALPLGYLLMRELAAADRLVIRRVIGGLVLMVLLLRWRQRAEPCERLAWGWGALAGGLSGVLQGLANIGGPPLVLWLHAQRLSGETLRATISGITLPQVPVQLAMLLSGYGLAILPSPGEMTVMLAAVAAGHYLGMGVGSRLPTARVRQLATALLVLICINAILGGK